MIPLDFLSSLFARREELPPFAVDDHGVRGYSAAGHPDALAWAELRSFSVRTLPCGPFVEDVYFRLVGPRCEFFIAQGHPAVDDLLERAYGLPGFDSSALISAMSCTDDAEFVCWRRDV